MDDLAMRKLCAEAMGLTVSYLDHMKYLMIRDDKKEGKNYDPLRDDAQAMALVKKFKLSVGIITVWKAGEEHPWIAEGTYRAGDTTNPDVNRAIVECVAKMQVYLATRTTKGEPQ